MQFHLLLRIMFLWFMAVGISGCTSARTFPFPDPVLQLAADRKSDEVPFDFRAKLVGPDGMGVPDVQLAFSHSTPSPILYRIFGGGSPSSEKDFVLITNKGGWISYRSRRGAMIHHFGPDPLCIHIDGIWYDRDPQSGPTQFVSYKEGSRFIRNFAPAPTPDDPQIYTLKPMSDFDQRALLIAAERRGYTKETIPSPYQLLPKHGWPPAGASGGYGPDE